MKWGVGNRQDDDALNENAVELLEYSICISWYND